MSAVRHKNGTSYDGTAARNSYTDQPGFGNNPGQVPFAPFGRGVPWTGQTDSSFYFTYAMRIAVVCEEPSGHAISDSAAVAGSFKFSVTYNADGTVTIGSAPK